MQTQVKSLLFFLKGIPDTGKTLQGQVHQTGGMLRDLANCCQKLSHEAPLCQGHKKGGFPAGVAVDQCRGGGPKPTVL